MHEQHNIIATDAPNTIVGDPQQDAENIVDKLNAISPTMCMAKWTWTSIHLTNGTTNSCFLPPS